MSRRFATLSVGTISSPAGLAAAEGHNRRLTAPLNADSSRASLNIDLAPIGLTHLSFNERVDRRLTALGIKHPRRGVLAVELLFGMSFEAQVHVPVDEWQVAVMSAAEQMAGPDNIFAADLHLDEATPHLHVFFTPIVEAMRKRRGPLPKGSRCRQQRKLPVLSFAQCAGHNRDEVGKTFSRWHDIHALAVKPFGLERGVVGGRAQHIPQKRLYAQTEEIEREGEKLIKLMDDPSALFSGLRRPSVDELANDLKWATYLAYVSGNAKKVLASAKANIPSLVELGKGGLFEKRAREKIRQLDVDRNQWQQRATTAEKNVGLLCDANAAEVRALESRLRDMETPPLQAREIAAMLGLPVITRRGRDGRPVDQIVTATGEVLTLSGDWFLRPDNTKQSVIRFLQHELALNSQEVFALLKASVGEPRTVATFTAMFRHMPVPEKSFDLSLPTADARKRALQANLESLLQVSQKATGRLMEENLLTVDSKGCGVLLPQDGERGYTFKPAQGRCEFVSGPTGFESVYLGDALTWTSVISEDIGVALRVYDATEGKISSTLVPARSVTEERLNLLRRGHREILATPSVFSPGWDASQSVIIRSPAVCVSDVVEIMRSSKHPIYTDGVAGPRTAPGGGMAWR